MRKTLFLGALMLAFPAIAGAEERALASLSSAAGKNVSGAVRFSETDGRTTVEVDAGELAGEHAIHVHEFGDCSAADFASAGPHYNPTGMAHGGPESAVRHVGDLGNFRAAANGRIGESRLDSLLALSGEHSIVGRSVVIHEKADDLRTDPAGNSGARIACGVIGRAKSR